MKIINLLVVIDMHLEIGNWVRKIASWSIFALSNTQNISPRKLFSQVNEFFHIIHKLGPKYLLIWHTIWKLVQFVWKQIGDVFDDKVKSSSIVVVSCLVSDDRFQTSFGNLILIFLSNTAPITHRSWVLFHRVLSMKMKITNFKCIIGKD